MSGLECTLLLFTFACCCRSFPPEGRSGMSDVSLSGICGLSFDSTLLSPLCYCYFALPGNSSMPCLFPVEPFLSRPFLSACCFCLLLVVVASEQKSHHYLLCSSSAYSHSLYVLSFFCLLAHSPDFCFKKIL